jgi:hypothetical protein
MTENTLYALTAASILIAIYIHIKTRGELIYLNKLACMNAGVATGLLRTLNHIIDDDVSEELKAIALKEGVDLNLDSVQNIKQFAHDSVRVAKDIVDEFEKKS